MADESHGIFHPFLVVHLSSNLSCYTTTAAKVQLFTPSL